MFGHVVLEREPVALGHAAIGRVNVVERFPRIACRHEGGIVAHEQAGNPPPPGTVNPALVRSAI
jgi:hypothetical protein